MGGGGGGVEGVLGVHIWVACVRGLPDACGGVFSGVGLVCSVFWSYMNGVLQPTVMRGQTVLGDLL